MCILDAFRVVDDVLRQASRASATSSRCPGLINHDFADVRAIMKHAGSALMGIGRASGENRAVEAAQHGHCQPAARARHPGAQGILWNITGSSTCPCYEVNEAAEEIPEAADPEANIIFGTSFNERLGDEVMVTVIATGFDGGSAGARPARGDRRLERDRAESPRERDFLEELERQREGPTAARRDRARRRRRGARVRRRPSSVPSARPRRRAAHDYDADDLEIPSFLRRKYPRRSMAGRTDQPMPERDRGAGRVPARASPRGSRPRLRGPAANRATSPRRRLQDRAGGRLPLAVAAGLTTLGENRVQEAERRRRVLGRDAGTSSARSSRTRPAGRSSFRCHRVGRFGRSRRAARSPGPRGPRSRPARYPILLQVNVDDDPAKAGFDQSDLPAARSGFAAPTRSRSAGS